MVAISSSGMGDVINNQESIGRIAKWGLEIMGLDITYTPLMAIKSQVRANFIVDWTEE